MTLLLTNLQRHIPLNTRLLLAQATLAHKHLSARADATASITLTTNAHVRLLNARHALRKKYTDVLTFRQDPLPLPPRAACAPYLDPRTGRLEHDPRLVPHIAAHAGDIFLAVPFCARLAVPRALRAHEYLLLATIHGLAHLAGHVHNTAPAARRMKAAEERAVAALCEAFALATCRAEAAAENVPFIPTSYLP